MNAIACASLVLCLAASLSTAANAADDPLTALAGTWTVVDATVNGKSIKDPQITGSQLTFSDQTLLMEPGNGSTRERHKLKFEDGAEPAAYYSERIEPANRPQSGWTIFEVKDGSLRIAFFDAFKGRPTSFEPQPKLLVVQLKKSN